MEDFSGEIKKNIKSVPMPKYSKSTQKWTLLFVGSHGKTIMFKRFKGLFLFFMFILFSAIAAAAGLYVLYDLQVKTGKTIQQETDRLRKQIADLKKENEVLMARAIVAESKLPIAAPEKPKPEPAPPTVAPPRSSEETVLPESQTDESDDAQEEPQKQPAEKKKNRKNR